MLVTNGLAYFPPKNDFICTWIGGHVVFAEYNFDNFVSGNARLVAVSCRHDVQSKEKGSISLTFLAQIWSNFWADIF